MRDNIIEVEMYCENCDRHTRHRFKGNFKDGIRILGRYICKDCGIEKDDIPLNNDGTLIKG